MTRAKTAATVEDGDFFVLDNMYFVAARNKAGDIHLYPWVHDEEFSLADAVTPEQFDFANAALLYRFILERKTDGQRDDNTLRT